MSTTPRDVAVVAASQTPSYRLFNDSEPKLIMRCVNDILERTGLDRGELQFTIAGSCDYLSGMPFAFVSNIDGVGAWPHVSLLSFQSGTVGSGQRRTPVTGPFTASTAS